ncbi:MAG TPA: NADH-quinone oxidoreductase subunit NuoH [Planctomycetales bacterium]|jgi:NADH-quinone oxidoreductase subunit H|nr:NADH-quinone oxidoreductase subunit NuoH [Planctomycetales bacterium]
MYADFNIWITLILIALVMAVLPLFCAYLVLLERKIAAWTQDRLGPTRVGPGGLLQPIADGVKFIFKEQIIPGKVDKLFYLVAPAVSLMAALMAFAVVPFGRTATPPSHHDWPETVQQQEERDNDPTYAHDLAEYNRPGQAHLNDWGLFNNVQWVIAPHVDVGMVYVFAVGSLAVYAIILGGWSSNSKYSFLGALRSSAQLISYEIPLGLAVLGVFYTTGSLNLERIIEYQLAHGWNFLFQPVAALLFAISVFAECNRLPFDLPETEQELVGGYHTEYTGMKLLLFLLAEYVHMVTTSFLMAALFFGGWELPFVAVPGHDGAGSIILKLIVFSVKMFLFICFYMFVRWTIPRFKFDQLMGLAWKVLMPLALFNVVVVLCVRHFEPLGEYSHWLIPPITIAALVGLAAYSATLKRPPTRIRTLYRGHNAEQLTLGSEHAVSP